MICPVFENTEGRDRKYLAIVISIKKKKKKRKFLLTYLTVMVMYYFSSGSSVRKKKCWKLISKLIKCLNEFKNFSIPFKKNMVLVSPFVVLYLLILKKEQCVKEVLTVYSTVSEYSILKKEND